MVTTAVYQASQDRVVRTSPVQPLDKVSTAVYVTQNYPQFKLDPINRPIDQAKLVKLYDAISAKNLLADNPILVSLSFVVLDGQHRLKVAEAMGVPIYYQFASDTQMEDVSGLNKNRTPWKFSDFLSSWCERGNPEYIRLREFVKRYDWMYPSIAMEMCYYGSNGTMRDDFANGKYQCNDVEFAERVAQAVLDFRSIGFRYWNSRVFVYAVSQLLSNSEYNHATMMQRLERNREALYPAVNTDDYFKIFNRIYNRKASVNRVELEKLHSNDPRYRADKKAEKAAKAAA